MSESPMRVLVVEDNPADVLLVQKALTEGGAHRFRMEHVTRLDSALKCVTQCEFDVVLVDLSLPDEQGLETVRRVHAAASPVAIVVLTGTSDERIGLEALRCGAQD